MTPMTYRRNVIYAKDVWTVYMSYSSGHTEWNLHNGCLDSVVLLGAFRWNATPRIIYLDCVRWLRWHAEGMCYYTQRMSGRCNTLEVHTKGNLHNGFLDSVLLLITFRWNATPRIYGRTVWDDSDDADGMLYTQVMTRRCNTLEVHTKGNIHNGFLDSVLLLITFRWNATPRIYGRCEMTPMMQMECYIPKWWLDGVILLRYIQKEIYTMAVWTV